MMSQVISYHLIEPILLNTNIYLENMQNVYRPRQRRHIQREREQVRHPYRREIPSNKEQFPVSKWNGSTNQTCAICLEDFQKNEEVRTLRCFHVFHKSHIDEWLSMNPSCPLCKTDCS